MENVLGIIAGGGELPGRIIDYCRSNGREFFVLVFAENTEVVIGDVPHAIVRLGAIGESLERLRNAGVKEIVMAGKMKRPSLASVRPDATATKLLARLGVSFFGGDDALLKALIKFMEDEGFKIVGADSLLGQLLAPLGVIGKIAPDARAEADIKHALKVAKKLGELDIGQAVIVENGYVLGVEAAEGTDALIARCAEFKREARGGVLVKIKKPGQESRVDLPAIGPRTVEKIAAAGLAGIAVQAKGSLILDSKEVVEKADALGVFVVGIKP